MPFESTTNDKSWALPLLVLSYSVLMMHSVFSRSFRDSLLGSGLAVGDLPGLTFVGTLLAITLSLLMSFFLRTDRRIRVIRAIYAINALVEIAMALGYKNHPWVYSAYYIEVSASTAIGLSLIWILIGDWSSKCNASDIAKIPVILICGTAAGMFAGFGIVHIPGESQFNYANFLLAAMNLFVFLALLFYRDSSCVTNPRSPLTAITPKRAHWASVIVRILAMVTVLGAASSTLLDLVFRVAVADHYTDQSSRLHFVGLFQGILCFGSLITQFGMKIPFIQHLRQGAMKIHASILFAGSWLAAVSPSFIVLASLRATEYSLRNSAFRVGTEMTYVGLPDQLRVEVRPLIDVVGERVGDIIAAGVLQWLLLSGNHLTYRPVLLILGVSSCVLWALSSLLARYTRHSIHTHPEPEKRSGPIPLHKMASEESLLT